MKLKLFGKQKNLPNNSLVVKEDISEELIRNIFIIYNYI